MERFGFIYVWFDRKKKRYYIGSHWGTENDGYVCSSNWMRTAYKRRPQDFRRRIAKRIHTNRVDLLEEEQRWLNMIKPEEQKGRYYNLRLQVKQNWHTHERSRKEIGRKIGDANKGKALTPERRQKISEALTGRTYPGRHTNKGKPWSEARRKAQKAKKS